MDDWIQSHNHIHHYFLDPDAFAVVSRRRNPIDSVLESDPITVSPLLSSISPLSWFRHYHFIEFNDFLLGRDANEQGRLDRVKQNSTIIFQIDDWILTCWSPIRALGSLRSITRLLIGSTIQFWILTPENALRRPVIKSLQVPVARYQMLRAYRLGLFGNVLILAWFMQINLLGDAL